MVVMIGSPDHLPVRARLRAGRSWLWGIALAVGIGGCAAAPPPPLLVAGPGQSLEQLDAGKGLFANHCQGCHSLPDPGQLAPGSWPAKVAGMSRKSGLSSAQVNLVSDYLVAASRASHPQQPSPPRLVAANRPTP